MTAKLQTVVKPFTWCPDGTGVTSEDVAPGDERDFGEYAEALEREGFIRMIKGSKPDRKAGDEALDLLNAEKAAAMAGAAKEPASEGQQDEGAEKRSADAATAAGRGKTE